MRKIRTRLFFQDIALVLCTLNGFENVARSLSCLGRSETYLHLPFFFLSPMSYSLYDFFAARAWAFQWLWEIEKRQCIYHCLFPWCIEYDVLCYPILLQTLQLYFVYLFPSAFLITSENWIRYFYFRSCAYFRCCLFEGYYHQELQLVYRLSIIFSKRRKKFLIHVNIRTDSIPFIWKNLPVTGMASSATFKPGNATFVAWLIVKAEWECIFIIKFTFSTYCMATIRKKIGLINVKMEEN